MMSTSWLVKFLIITGVFTSMIGYHTRILGGVDYGELGTLGKMEYHVMMILWFIPPVLIVKLAVVPWWFVTARTINAELDGSGCANGFFGRIIGHVISEVERDANDSLLTFLMRFFARVFITTFISKNIRLGRFAIELIGVDYPDGYFDLGLLGKALFHLGIVLCYVPLSLFVRWVVFPPLWRIATWFVWLIAAVSGRYRC